MDFTRQTPGGGRQCEVPSAASAHSFRGQNMTFLKQKHRLLNSLYLKATVPNLASTLNRITCYVKSFLAENAGETADSRSSVWCSHIHRRHR